MKRRSPRTIILVEERTKALDELLKAVAVKVKAGLADHEKRLIRLETMVEIARPHGGVPRIAPPAEE
ncbi:MAG TPA: hypothetical protein VMD03_06245 [Steroidobacteraceae bacterium]|nr:hypothetical protein [Steroidobacteraceae bacterium]